MKRLFCVAVVLALFFLLDTANAGPAAAKPWTAATSAEPSPATTTSNQAPERPGIFERRRLGLTPGKALKTARELKKAGELTGNASADAAIVAEAMIAATPELQPKPEASPADIDDWTEFLEFLLVWLEKLLELFMAFGLI